MKKNNVVYENLSRAYKSVLPQLSYVICDYKNIFLLMDHFRSVITLYGCPEAPQDSL